MSERTESINSPQAQRVRNVRNVRLALILASIALAFFVGFVVKITLLGKA